MNMKPKPCKLAILAYFLKRQCFHYIWKFDLNATSNSEAINKICILHKIAVLLGKGGRWLVNIKLIEPTYFIFIYREETHKQKSIPTYLLKKIDLREAHKTFESYLEWEKSGVVKERTLTFYSIYFYIFYFSLRE